MENKIGDCSCGLKNILLHKVGEGYYCTQCAKRRLPEDERKRLEEETGDKDTLFG